jgi:hypothetical protein
MDRSQWFEPKWKTLRKAAKFALVGLLPIAMAVLLREPAVAAIAVLFLIPLLVWLVLIPLLHWRERYRGTNMTLWGALLVLETSGWFKIIYWFRHVLPDHRATGRYSDAP